MNFMCPQDGSRTEVEIFIGNPKRPHAFVRSEVSFARIPCVGEGLIVEPEEYFSDEPPSYARIKLVDWNRDGTAVIQASYLIKDEETLTESELKTAVDNAKALLEKSGWHQEPKPNEGSSHALHEAGSSL